MSNTRILRTQLTMVHDKVRERFPLLKNLKTAVIVTGSKQDGWTVVFTEPVISDVIQRWMGKADNAYEARSKAWKYVLEQYDPIKKAA